MQKNVLMSDSNQGFKMVDDLLSSVGFNLEKNIRAVQRYTPEIFFDRLMQKITEVAIGPCAHIVAANQSLTSAINCKLFIINGLNGSLHVGCGQYTINYWRFFIRWLYALSSIALPLFATKTKAGVLVYGVGEESIFLDKNDSEFIRFCRQGPITPLSNGKRYLIQYRRKIQSANSIDFDYCLNPLIALMKSTRVGIKLRIKIFLFHIYSLYNFTCESLRLPIISILGEDFAYSAIAHELSQAGYIESIILSTSFFSCQPLWARNLPSSQVHIVSYSQNWRPASNYKTSIEANHPILKYVRGDVHWVWTNSFSEYLKRISHAKKVHVVGPILWYLPKKEKALSVKHAITIFDVPALSDEVMLDCGQTANYFSSFNLQKFINDIVSAKREIERAHEICIHLTLKTKRKYSAAYLKEYFDFIEELERLNEFKIAPQEVNMFELIESSAIVVAYPFTSPAYVADSLCIDSIYYDPTGAIKADHFGDNETKIKFVQSYLDLYGSLLEGLGLVSSI